MVETPGNIRIEADEAAVDHHDKNGRSMKELDPGKMGAQPADMLDEVSFILINHLKVNSQVDEKVLKQKLSLEML